MDQLLHLSLMIQNELKIMYASYQDCEAQSDQKIHDRPKFAINLCLIYLAQLALQISLGWTSYAVWSFGALFYPRGKHYDDVLDHPHFTPLFYIIFCLVIVIPVSVVFISRLRQETVIKYVVGVYSILYALFVAGLSAPKEGWTVIYGGHGKNRVVNLGFVYLDVNTLTAGTIILFILYILIRKDKFEQIHLYIIGVAAPLFIAIIQSIYQGFGIFFPPFLIVAMICEYFVFMLMAMVSGRFNLRDDQYIYGSIIAYIRMWNPWLKEMKQ